MSTQQKVLTIVHGNCSDGVGAGYCAYLKFNSTHDLDMLFVSPSNQDQMVTYLRDYMVTHPTALVRFFDLGLRGSILEEVDSLGIDYLAFDHHIGSNRDIKNHYDGLGKDIPSQYTFDNDRSGVRLAWDYFFPGEECPMALAYLEDGDLWRFALPDSKTILPGLYSMLPLNTSTELSDASEVYSHWDNCLSDPDLIKKAFDIGTHLMQDQEKRMNSLKGKCSVININGFRAYICNTSSFDLISKMGNNLVNMKDENGEYLADYSLLWHYDARNKQYGVSLRSRRAEDQGVDVSMIAKGFDPNGGGHYSASGFKTKNLWQILGLVETQG